MNRMLQIILVLLIGLCCSCHTSDSSNNLRLHSNAPLRHSTTSPSISIDNEIDETTQGEEQNSNNGIHYIKDALMNFNWLNIFNESFQSNITLDECCDGNKLKFIDNSYNEILNMIWI